MDIENFKETIEKGYECQGEKVLMGVACLDGKAIQGLDINIPLSMFNRHGLIAGATGTGKTKTLQGIAESLSLAGVPVMLMDIKGDLSGLGAKGTANDIIDNRYALMEANFDPQSFPIEFLTLSKEKGVRLRATVTEFGPILLSKILDLNDTQSGLLSAIFQCADDNGWLLLDLDDMKTVLNYTSDIGKADFESKYGKMSTVSTGTILRKIIELETQGADEFFGELSFDVQDLMGIKNDKGVISILRVTDMQDRPKLFSTYMLQMLAELYATLPEAGDIKKPKLVLFIDEAHLLFNEASKVLLNQIESVIKLIRSKGVGIFFCTQNPTDIPDAVLSQLGLKVQHALRAFTANDRTDIKKASQNYPETEFYKTEDVMTQMGIGEALLTALNEKGIPTPLAHIMVRPPYSRMGVLSPDEIEEVIENSTMVDKYAEDINRQSAYEILTQKIEEAKTEETEEKKTSKSTASKKQVEEKSVFQEVIENPITKSVMRSTANTIVRSLLGAIGLTGGSRRRKSIF